MRDEDVAGAYQKLSHISNPFWKIENSPLIMAHHICRRQGCFSAQRGPASSPKSGRRKVNHFQLMDYESTHPHIIRNNYQNSNFHLKRIEPSRPFS